MSQSISEQVMTIEHALGERMIEHAQVIVRGWLSELGENNRYEESCNRIQTEYRSLCQQWLVQGGPAVDEALDNLTGDMYELSDAVFADISMARGMAPQMHGFNPENKQSVINYFAHCVTLKQEDLDWLRRVADDPDKAAVALLAAGALSSNLRDYFRIDALLTLIDCMNAQTEMVADSCKVFVSTLLMHYDVRIDYFPQIQEAFRQTVSDMDDGGVRILELIGKLIQYSKENGLELYDRGEYRYEWLPEDVKKLIEVTGMREEVDTFRSWLPHLEEEYLNNLVTIFPETWLYKQMVEFDEMRVQYIALSYLYAGRMDLLWDSPDKAEEWLKGELRSETLFARHYLNYAHCMMLKGDRVMAYEYYLRARKRCFNSKEFFEFFRPDRRALIDRGVAVEDVYLMEDMLLTITTE